MSQAELDKGRELAVREGIKATKMSGVVIADDGSNSCVIPGYPYRFIAQRDKLLVSVDIFKSGYECKSCKGSGRIQSHCACEDTNRPGYKYSGGESSTPAQALMKCPKCQGDYITHRVNAVCPECNGKGALIYIPDQSKLLPTTGVIVSIGKDVSRRQNLNRFLYTIIPWFWKERFHWLIESELHNHMRILFGAYSGTMIPTKAPGVVFKVIRDIEVLLVIEGGEDLAAFDFVQLDQNP